MKHDLVWIAFAISLIASTQVSCAGDNAGELREIRATTITADAGPTLSIEYRPQQNFGLNVYAHDANDELNLGGMDPVGALWTKLEERSRNLKSEGIDIGVSTSYYPIRSSAFRVGLGLETHNSRVSFDSDTLDLDPYGFPGSTKTSYSQQSTYLSVPLGWSWIWESGFSFSLDFGPRFRLSRSTQWKNAGSSRVDTTFRDQYANQKEDEKNIQLGGSGGIGYSF